MERIGLGVITYERPEYFKQCMYSIMTYLKNKCDIIICDDGSIDKDKIKMLDEYSKQDIIILNQKDGNVAKNKNKAIKYFLNNNYDHIFTIEDDIIVKGPDVLQKYIEYAKEHNIHHLNFAHHGPHNVGQRAIYKGINVHPRSVGAFSYYTREVLETVGFIDENFQNVLEHVEYTYRITKAGMTTPFWLFADHPQSKELLEEIPGATDNSTIKPQEQELWSQKMRQGQVYWIKKHGTWLPPFQKEIWSNSNRT